jgi:hypothetical protein
MSKTVTVRYSRGIYYTIFSVCTAMIGYKIHSSIFWSIMDFIFTPIAWIKWLICEEVTLKIIKSTFEWFFK